MPGLGRGSGHYRVLLVLLTLFATYFHMVGIAPLTGPHFTLKGLPQKLAFTSQRLMDEVQRWELK